MDKNDGGLAQHSTKFQNDINWENARIMAKKRELWQQKCPQENGSLSIETSWGEST